MQILRDLVKELDHKEADRQYNLETRRATAMRHARETKEKLEKSKRKLVAKETEVGSGGFRLKVIQKVIKTFYRICLSLYPSRSKD